MSEATSLSLLERVRRPGDGDWNQFDKVYGPLIEGWLREGVCPQDATDVRQEVMLVVMRQIHSLDWSPVITPALRRK